MLIHFMFRYYGVSSGQVMITVTSCDSGDNGGQGGVGAGHKPGHTQEHHRKRFYITQILQIIPYDLIHMGTRDMS